MEAESVHYKQDEFGFFKVIFRMRSNKCVNIIHFFKFDAEHVTSIASRSLYPLGLQLRPEVDILIGHHYIFSKKRRFWWYFWSGIPWVTGTNCRNHVTMMFFINFMIWKWFCPFTCTLSRFHCCNRCPYLPQWPENGKSIRLKREYLLYNCLILLPITRVQADEK